MCGRFERHDELEAFARLIREPVTGDPALFKPEANIFPGTAQPVLYREGEEKTHAAGCLWGLVPSWVRKPGYRKPINARIETAAEKPMFRAAVRERRCLVPCNGFYEWQKLPEGKKQPFHVTLEDGAPFFLAGIRERNRVLGPEPMETFAILTTDANATIAPIHDRMPVTIPRDLLEPWLDSSSDPEKLLAKIKVAAQRTEFEARRINRVGD